MSNNLPLETSHPNEEEAASPFTSEKITNDTQQRKSQHNVNRDENSCRMPQKEPSNLWQKETPESGNHASQLIEVSPAIKQEPYDLQRRQSSDARHDVSGFHEEERAFSCKYENDADILMQNQTPNPWVPVQESNVPLVKAVEKLYPGMNLEEGIHRSQSDEGSIPSKVLPDLLKIPKDEPDNLHLRQSPYSGVQTSEMCDGERTSSVKRDMVSVALQPVQDFRGRLHHNLTNRS
ncbi:hypothetical protein DH2020_009555 [Rehmannia glutinosa]|uniref:Uncharacterized protein n=1 Tax=Rehmannia glutinosa TaxID=99300 RepID=A0ABR0X998_REHGL